MTMGRAQMQKQVTQTPMKKKKKKPMTYMKHGGSCRGMGAAKKGGKFKVS